MGKNHSCIILVVLNYSFQVGFESDQNTWEPEENLQDCKEKLEAFKRKDDTWVPEENKVKLLKR